MTRFGPSGLRWDVIVIGAGPAGASAAVRLADGGRRVLLVDRCGMPRPKVCGCCLSHVAVNELLAIGLPPDRLGGIPRTSVRLVAASREAVLPLPGWTLSRESLDAAIVRRAIAAGASWLPSTPVSAIEDTAAGVSVHALDPDGRPLRFEAVHAIVATGLAAGVRIRSDGGDVPRERSRSGSRIGVGATLPADSATVADGELVMHASADGYCGIVRLEDGRIDVAAAMNASAFRRHASAVAAVAAVLGRRRQAFMDLAGPACRFVGTPRLTRFQPAVVGRWRRIHRIGDAAAYVEPFTGEGIGWALVGARSIAEAMLAHPPTDGPATASAIADAHERSIARRLAGPRRRCLRVASAVRHPSIVSTAVAAARLVPAAAAWAMPHLVGREHAFRRTLP
jgi:flavin-dependent dehydrogenase